MLEPGSSISFQLTENQGAALVTKYLTYREDVQLLGNFEKYAKENYDSWMEFARDTGHGNDIKPSLVTGADMTRDFAMMSCSKSGDDLTSELIFLSQSSDADSVLIYHRDIALLHKVRSTTTGNIDCQLSCSRETVQTCRPN